jgi:hypothetical protein
MPTIAPKPPLIRRLIAASKNRHRLALSLGVPFQYAYRWEVHGYVPSRYSLAIEALGLRDAWGDITATDVALAEREVMDARRQAKREQAEAELAELEALAAAQGIVLDGEEGEAPDGASSE